MWRRAIIKESFLKDVGKGLGRNTVAEIAAQLLSGDRWFNAESGMVTEVLRALSCGPVFLQPEE